MSVLKIGFDLQKLRTDSDLRTVRPRTAGCLFPRMAKRRRRIEEPVKHGPIDYSNIVWPNPPAIARIKYQAFYAAEKISQVDAENSTKKAKWMDRLGRHRAGGGNHKNPMATQ